MEKEHHQGEEDLTEAGPHRAQKQVGQDMRDPQDQPKSDDRARAEKLVDVRASGKGPHRGRPHKDNQQLKA